MAPRLTWQVIEDNGGGLHLVVFEDDQVIFYGYEYEFDHLALRENLQALQRGEDPREDGWEAPADVDAPQRWYNELHVGELNGGVVIADNERIYYDRLGAEGTRFFIPRWDELELFDSDENTLTTPENIREALQEFRRDGGMLGVFFHFLGFPHEDPEDASTWGPESPEYVDWTGFPEVRITVDYENGDETWWEAANKAVEEGTAPKAVADWVKNGNIDGNLYVSRIEAEEIESWAATLPGWGEGPRHAPNTLLFHEF